MQVYAKTVQTLEVICRKPQRSGITNELESRGYRIVADRPDRMAGQGLFAEDLWYLKGEKKLTEQALPALPED